MITAPAPRAITLRKRRRPKRCPTPAVGRRYNRDIMSRCSTHSRALAMADADILIVHELGAREWQLGRATSPDSSPDEAKSIEVLQPEPLAIQGCEPLTEDSVADPSTYVPRRRQCDRRQT